MSRLLQCNLNRSDVRAIENTLGNFPYEEINCLLHKEGISIDSSSIPHSFEKYFAVMMATCSDGLAGKSLLDFGCGLGVFVAQASKLGMHAEGMDIFTEYSGRCFDAASQIVACISSEPPKLTRVDFLKQKVNHRVDFATSFGMLEHIHDKHNRDSVIRSMMDSLKPGGHMILTCGPNRRFPFDFFHYGPKFLFYHWFPANMRAVYLKVFSDKNQNQDPTWLNGMSVHEIKQSVSAHGGARIEQLFPLWVALARHRLFGYKILRAVAISVSKWLCLIQAEPVIIVIARKELNTSNS